ncbi:cupin domain-containing protein [Desulfuromonas acetoxidans]|nr:cupin domain-containing protein [Desulfuromonas acetoxidans]MBF0647121.1 cupin domain-containing protein [Desulfuromonas acetoxidans]NVD24777.1 cupin domain-containing protein [Desulfuromonas acetoxidans]NVE16822.1 cupin domain-containing protein [Desulfuromonas acetoxidans]
MENIREEVKELQIGMKVRNLRQERRMTLQDLANMTRLSKPLLSQIENNQVIPPLSTLLRIAKAFEVSLNCFFEDERDNTQCVVVRAGEQHIRQLRAAQTHGSQSYTYNSRAFGKTRHNMEPFDVEFFAREWSDDLLVRHEGEEFLYVLEGQLEFRHGDQTVLLNPGDSVYYDSTEPHGYIARSETQPRAIAVLYSKN